MRQYKGFQTFVILSFIYNANGGVIHHLFHGDRLGIISHHGRHADFANTHHEQSDIINNGAKTYETYHQYGGYHEEPDSGYYGERSDLLPQSGLEISKSYPISGFHSGVFGFPDYGIQNQHGKYQTQHSLKQGDKTETKSSSVFKTGAFGFGDYGIHNQHTLSNPEESSESNLSKSKSGGFKVGIIGDDRYEPIVGDLGNYGQHTEVRGSIGKESLSHRHSESQSSKSSSSNTQSSITNSDIIADTAHKFLDIYSTPQYVIGAYNQFKQLSSPEKQYMSDTTDIYGTDQRKLEQSKETSYSQKHSDSNHSKSSSSNSQSSITNSDIIVDNAHKFLDIYSTPQYVIGAYNQFKQLSSPEKQYMSDTTDIYGTDQRKLEQSKETSYSQKHSDSNHSKSSSSNYESDIIKQRAIGQSESQSSKSSSSNSQSSITNSDIIGDNAHKFLDIYSTPEYVIKTFETSGHPEEYINNLDNAQFQELSTSQKASGSQNLENSNSKLDVIKSGDESLKIMNRQGGSQQMHSESNSSENSSSNSKLNIIKNGIVADDILETILDQPKEVVNSYNNVQLETSLTSQKASQSQISESNYKVYAIKSDINGDRVHEIHNIPCEQQVPSLSQENSDYNSSSIINSKMSEIKTADETHDILEIPLAHSGEYKGSITSNLTYNNSESSSSNFESTIKSGVIGDAILEIEPENPKKRGYISSVRNEKLEQSFVSQKVSEYQSSSVLDVSSDIKRTDQEGNLEETSLSQKQSEFINLESSSKSSIINSGVISDTTHEVLEIQSGHPVENSHIANTVQFEQSSSSQNTSSTRSKSAIIKSNSDEMLNIQSRHQNVNSTENDSNSSKSDIFNTSIIGEGTLEVLNMNGGHYDDHEGISKAYNEQSSQKHFESKSSKSSSSSSTSNNIETHINRSDDVIPRVDNISYNKHIQQSSSSEKHSTSKISESNLSSFKSNTFNSVNGGGTNIIQPQHGGYHGVLYKNNGNVVEHGYPVQHYGSIGDFAIAFGNNGQKSQQYHESHSYNENKESSMKSSQQRFEKEFVI